MQEAMQHLQGSASQDAIPHFSDGSVTDCDAPTNEHVLAGASTCENTGMGAEGFEPPKA